MEEQGRAWIGSRRLGPPLRDAHWLGWRPLAVGTPRLRAGLQEGDEEAATSLRPAPPACSVAPAAPPGCSLLLSALSRLPAAPAWAWRRRVSAGEDGIRRSASSLSPGDASLGSRGDRGGPRRSRPRRGRAVAAGLRDAGVAATGGPAGGLRA